jgi:hypothetical protein
MAEATRHHPNLFVVIVGRTAKGRKGTSWDEVKAVLQGTTMAVAAWLAERTMGGLSSGEGLINLVRDRVVKEMVDEATGEVSQEIDDEGVADKRLLILETEFSRTLRVMLRTDNTLSAIMREAWDGGNLSVLTRRAPLRATAPHISMVAHTTVEDLRKYLGEAEAANGFGNRFLYACTERTKLLPFGGDRETLKKALLPLAAQLKAIVEQVPEGEITWADEAARRLWEEFYIEEAAERPGMLGAITARGEPQVVRIAMLYALLDSAQAIGERHLKAAIAVWSYCVASAEHVFGDRLGDDTADTVVAALRKAGAAGMTQTELSGLFGRHKTASELRAVVTVLPGGAAAVSLSVGRS